MLQPTAVLGQIADVLRETTTMKPNKLQFKRHLSLLKQRKPQADLHEEWNCRLIRLHGRSCTVAQAGQLAINEHNRGNAQVAADIYDLILVHVPNYAAVHNNKGNALRDMHRGEEALACYERAIALKPGYAQAHNNRGAMLQQLNRYDDALASCRAAISLEPDRANAHYNLGVTLQGLERYEEAVSSYDNAIALNPDYFAAYNNRGLCLLALKRFEEAANSQARAIALKPDSALSFFNLANALQEMKRFAEALEGYDRALSAGTGICRGPQQPGNDAVEGEPARRGSGALRAGHFLTKWFCRGPLQQYSGSA